MAYVCLQCKKKIKSVGNIIRCPYCGYRILVKERSPIAREVSTD